MTLTIYTRDMCSQCRQVERFLDAHNIEYKDINIDHDADAFDYVKSHGYKATPIIMIGKDNGETETVSGAGSLFTMMKMTKSGELAHA